MDMWPGSPYPLGASYDEGARLFKIVKTDELEMHALVPATDVALTPYRRVSIWATV